MILDSRFILSKPLVERVIAEGAVYCIGPMGAQRVKIGWSVSPFDRVKALQCGSPDYLLIYALIPGERKSEKVLHEVFEDRRVKGEWFDNSDGEIVDTFLALVDRIVGRDVADA